MISPNGVRKELLLLYKLAMHNSMMNRSNTSMIKERGRAAPNWYGARALVITVMGMGMLSQAGAAVFATRQGAPDVMSIVGEIRPGDFSRFKAFIRAQWKPKNNYDPRTVYLNSPGGDVGEALLFAEHFDKGFFSTFVVEKSVCYSACTIMFAGGAERNFDSTSRLGFHRLSLKRNELDIQKARAETTTANERVNAFFKKVGFPTILVERMNETPPSDIFLVDQRWVQDHGIDRQLSYQPAFLDVAEKQCGRNPMYPSVGLPALQAYPKKAFAAWMACSDDVKSINGSLAYSEELSQKQRSDEKNLADVMRGFKAMRWEIVSPSWKEFFVDRKDAIRSGNVVTAWFLENDIYKGKEKSTLSKRVFNCSNRTQWAVAGISCDGRMCENPLSYYEIDDPTVHKTADLPTDSPFALMLAAACGAK